MITRLLPRERLPKLLLLLAGDPPIHVGGGGYGDEINQVMINVQDGEEKIIADRLREILRPAKK